VEQFRRIVQCVAPVNPTQCNAKSGLLSASGIAQAPTACPPKGEGCHRPPDVGAARRARRPPPRRAARAPRPPALEKKTRGGGL
jgi:hypothetical protein